MEGTDTRADSGVVECKLQDTVCSYDNIRLIYVDDIAYTVSVALGQQCFIMGAATNQAHC